MSEPIRIERHASELFNAARKLEAAAEQRGSHLAAPEVLVSLEEALRLASAAWYQLAADAVPRGGDRRGLSRENEVQLVGALHDVAAAFARCARACREGQRISTPIIARAVMAVGTGSPPDRCSYP